MVGRWLARALALGFGGLVTSVALSAPPIPGALSFAPGSQSGQSGLRASNPRMTLLPVVATELLGGTRADRGARVGLATSLAGGLNLNGALQLPPLAAYIRRELPDVWRFVPPASKTGLAAVPQFRVELRSLTGRSGQLSLLENSNVTVPVQVRASQQLINGANGELWYEGSIVLEIPVAALTQAGTYSGRIEISQESL